MPDTSTTRSRCCSHCGSFEIYPAPGPLGALTGALGLLRYRCRACRRPFWLVASRDAHPGLAPDPADPPQPVLDVPERPDPASLEGLDEVAPPRARPESADADLSPLDAEMAELHSPALKRPRRRRGH